MEPIQLQLTVEDINLILEALGDEPFVKVYALIGKIQEQARIQVGSTGETNSIQREGGDDE
jgi:hypothetical protein